jgi:hypothetical protein
MPTIFLYYPHCDIIPSKIKTIMNPISLYSGKENILYQILQKDYVVDFVKSNLKDSYTSYFKDHEKEVNIMIEDAFCCLLESQFSLIDNKHLKQIIKTIDKKIFHKDQSYFWFNRMYQEYKKFVRPRKDYEKIREFINGKKNIRFW